MKQERKTCMMEGQFDVDDESSQRMFQKQHILTLHLGCLAVTVTTSRILLMKDPGSFVDLFGSRDFEQQQQQQQQQESQVHFGGVCVLTLSHHCNPMVLYESPCPGDFLGKEWRWYVRFRNLH